MIEDSYSCEFLLAIGLLPAELEMAKERSKDFELVDTWIAEKGRGKNSSRAMEKEMKRFLFWSMSVARKNIEDIRGSDIKEYDEFMRNPTPSESWVCSTKFPKLNNAWRPFAAPLNQQARWFALVHIRNYFSWAITKGVINENPVERKSRPNSVICGGKNRSIPPDAVDLIFEAAENQRNSNKIARDIIIFKLLLQAGLTRSEIMAADFEHIQGGDNEFWINILGKQNGTPRRVPVSVELVREMERYRDRFNSYADCKASTPLVLPATGRIRRLCAATLLSVIKSTSNRAKKIALARNREDLIGIFDNMTAFMLRHSCLATVAESTGDIYLVKALGGLSLKEASKYFNNPKDMHSRILSAVNRSNPKVG